MYMSIYQEPSSFFIRVGFVPPQSPRVWIQRYHGVLKELQTCHLFMMPILSFQPFFRFPPVTWGRGNCSPTWDVPQKIRGYHISAQQQRAAACVGSMGAKSALETRALLLTLAALLSPCWWNFHWIPVQLDLPLQRPSHHVQHLVKDVWFYLWNTRFRHLAHFVTQSCGHPAVGGDTGVSRYYSECRKHRIYSLILVWDITASSQIFLSPSLCLGKPAENIHINPKYPYNMNTHWLCHIHTEAERWLYIMVQTPTFPVVSPGLKRYQCL